MLSRRQCLGAGLALALALPGCASPGSAAPTADPFEAWQALAHWARQRPGDAAGLAAAALLAPSPHNTQPWRFGLQGQTLSLWADPSRHVGGLDPLRRELWMGLGCALENMVQACPGLGLRLRQLRCRPDPAQPLLAATLHLAPAPQRADAEHPALQTLARRHTYRAPMHPLPDASPGLWSRLAALADSDEPGAPGLGLWPAGHPMAQQLCGATLAATQAIVANASLCEDSHRWWRHGPHAVARWRDGLSLPTAGLSPWLTWAGQWLPEPDAQTAAGHWLRSTEQQVASAAGWGVITWAQPADPRQCLQAGRLWQRLHLALTAQGLVAQPMNAWPEWLDHRVQAGPASAPKAHAGRPEPDLSAWSEALAPAHPAGQRIGFVFRQGGPTRPVPASARRPLAGLWLPEAGPA